MKQGHKILLSLLIVIIGAIPRSIELLNRNYLFGFDQGLFFQAVKRIVVDGKLTLIGAEIGGRGGIFQGPGWNYLLSIPFFLTNGDPYAAMALMFLFGISTIAFTIILGGKIFNYQAAFLIAVLIAISPQIIPQSRFIWPPFPISLLSVFFLFFLFKVLQKQERFLPFLFFTIGLIVHFEVSVAATLFLQIFLFLPLLLIKRFISFRYIFWSIVSFFLVVSPLVIFDLRHSFIVTKGALRLVGGSDMPHEVTTSYIQAIAKEHQGVFLYNFLSTFQLSNLLWPVVIGVIVYGSYLYLNDKKKNIGEKLFLLYLLHSPFLFFIIFMFYLWPMWNWWLIELPIFYCFLVGLLLSYLWRKKFIIRPFIAILLFLFFSSFVTQTITIYRNDINDYGGIHKIKGKIDAIDYIYNDAKGKKFGLFVFTPPIYTYAYDYLLWWHGERTFHYLPHKEKKGLFYLLIEKDPAKPWTYKGWLETVIKEGTIIETKELPSGFIIQKRFNDEKETSI